MANNLLDKSSIILTPTAYNNGKALCVKPSDGSGDFDFSRNSAATRVNAQGLVENVQILSSNLVQNGDFSEEGAEEVSNGSFTNGSTDWTLGTGWSIGVDKATFDETIGGAGNLNQGNILTVGKTYKLTFDTLETNGGNLAYAFGNNSVFINNIQADTTHVVYGVADDVFLKIRGASNFNGSITNISVKEVGQNWTLGSGWSIGEDKAICDGTTENLDQDALTIGKSYKAQFTVSDLTTGTLSFRLGGTNEVININSNGTYTVYGVANGVTLRLRSQSGFDGSVTNISVIEISTDTNLPRINYENFSYQDALGSELVTGDNSNFDTSLGNWQQFRGVSVWDSLLKAGKWTDNGTTGSPKGFTMSGGVIPTSANTSYILEFKAKSNTTDTINFNRIGEANNDFTATSNPNLTSDFQNYKFIVNTSLANQRLYVGFDATSFNNGESYWIDNVSVKEYLGQEVVPDSGCGSWLFESQSTNLYTQSELFTDSSWAKTQTVIEDASITLPNGLTNGFKLFANTTGGTNHWLEKSPFPTATTGQDYTLSLFVKSAGSDFIQIASSSGFPSKYQNFNISTGTKASGDISDSSITDFGNGWYRISVTETTTGTQARYLIVPILSDGVRNPQFAGNADKDGVYIWGAMLEQNSFSTSYIPTEGSTVTRNQDVCTNGGSLATINSTEGVLYAEIAALADDGTNRIIGISDGTNGNRVQIYYSTASNSFIGLVYSGGVFSCSLNTTLSNATDFIKVAFKYKENDFALWVNGVEVATDTSGNSPIGLDRLDFRLGIGILPFFGKTKALAVWKEALSDAELTELTTI